MAMRVFQLPFHVTGTLAANVTIIWTAPFDCQLIHVSAQCITQDAAVDIYDDGTQINDTLTVTAGTTPCTQDAIGDFVGDQYPHIAKGSVMRIDVDNGSNAVDTFVVLTFTEG